MRRLTSILCSYAVVHSWGMGAKTWQWPCRPTGTYQRLSSPAAGSAG